MFFIFIKACKKYKFTFSFLTHGKLILTLYPNNSFDVISIRYDYNNFKYNRMFLEAIKKMRDYRKGEQY